MGWKATGEPLVRRQRDKWVVRVDGVDTQTGRHHPRQLGTYASKRSAEQKARAFTADGTVVAGRGTVSWLVLRWVASRTDISQKGREQYEWAANHIVAALGAVHLDRLDRADVARWLDGMAAAGKLSRRSIEICRTVLRAALTDAVEEGLLRRNPAARVPLPKVVAKAPREKEAKVWSVEEVQRFLASAEAHRWGAGFRLCALYGLRRSELLALRWDDVDLDALTVRIDEGLVAVSTGVVWTNGKTARSRRIIPVDPATARALAARRRAQLLERLVAGAGWEDNDLVLATRTGRAVSPSNFDHTLKLVVERAGVPHLSSHGLRHTAATNMVRFADDVGELRAAAEVLGHSPDMLLRIYAHTVPESLRKLTDKVGRRGG